MSAGSKTFPVPTDAELLQAQADLWRHSLYYLTSTALKCAVELGIPTALHSLGGSATAKDLVTALSLPETKVAFLRRLMRLLVTSGIFASDTGAATDVETFRLNPLSWLLVDGVDAEDHTNQKHFVLATVSRHYVEAALSLADWFKKDLAPPLPSPFEEHHGVPLLDHEKTPLLDSELHDSVLEGVAAHDNLAIGAIMRECHGLLRGVQSLAIVKPHPDVKCTVPDRPEVIKTVPADGVVSCAASDVFKSVPPSQAVLLKLVLHHWSDEDCVKILEQCRKAIPSREEGGKVIVIDIVLGPSLGPVMFEAQLLMDMLMMVNTKGRQRDENDWREIFKKAGFSDYKIVKTIGARGVIEVYP